MWGNRPVKRILGTLTVVIIITIALVAFLGKSWIGERLFAAAVESRAGVDRSAALPDGLHVYVCGSGSPMPDADRAGPCLAVLAGRDSFVFDAGSGSIRKLGAMGFPMNKLQAAFLTHLHSDHLDGLGELMLQGWIAGGRSTPLPVYGPVGTEQVIAGFMQVYDIDKGYRIAHHGPEVARPGGFGAEARIIDFSAQQQPKDVIIDREGITIRGLMVDHAPVDKAIAYRIEYKNRSIVISGDTVYSPALEKFSEGADLIFHEALNPEMVGQIGAALARRGNADGAKIMADIPDYHTSPKEAARLAQGAKAQALVLYHLVPAPPTSLIESAFLDGADDQFSGELHLARDGMQVSLPAGGETITYEQLL